MIKCALCGEIIDAVKDLEDYVEASSGIPANEFCCGDTGMLCDECGEKEEIEHRRGVK